MSCNWCPYFQHFQLLKEYFKRFVFPLGGFLFHFVLGLLCSFSLTVSYCFFLV